jgi:CBS domain-containing membrane protein
MALLLRCVIFLLPKTMFSLPAPIRRYFPDPITIDTKERAKSLLGALIGICVTGLVSRFFIGPDSVLPWLVAPMGASAVLLFAVPASPLAQPWPVIGGNVLSALVGVACGIYLSDPLALACVAVGAAIAVMFALRCVHPPGGAVALGTALGGPAIAKYGYWFALSPVALNSFLLLLTAIVYNNLCGRRYPHFGAVHGKQHRTADAPPSERLGITPEDLDAALKQYNQALDISRDDLQEILARTEMQAYQRRVGQVTCGDIMSRDVVRVQPETGLRQAWRLLRGHRIKALPVVDRSGCVIGIVTQQDFIERGGLRGLLPLMPRLYLGKPDTVGQIMTSAVRTVSVGDPIAGLVPLFSDGGLHQAPVVDGERRLVGILTQSDLIAALYRSGLQGEQPRLRHVA